MRDGPAGRLGHSRREDEETLNKEAADGWQVVFMVVEQKRFLLFWTREAVIITLGR